MLLRRRIGCASRLVPLGRFVSPRALRSLRVLPCPATRANFAADGETRYYQAVYLLNYASIGKMSETLVVTVPGSKRINSPR